MGMQSETFGIPQQSHSEFWCFETNKQTVQRSEACLKTLSITAYMKSVFTGNYPHGKEHLPDNFLFTPFIAIRRDKVATATSLNSNLHM